MKTWFQIFPYLLLRLLKLKFCHVCEYTLNTLHIIHQFILPSAHGFGILHYLTLAQRFVILSLSAF
jgi:hypothetical protein